MAPSITHARVLTCYYREKPGGLCKRLFRAMGSLLDSGHEVHYVAVTRFPIHHARCHFHRFPWPASHTDNAAFWVFFHIVAPFLLLYLGIRHRISHAFAFSPTYALMLQPLRMIRRIPLTLFLRADALRNHELRGRSPLLIRMEHLLESLAISGAHVYTVSRALRNTIITRHKRLSQGNVDVLPNDIPSLQVVPHRKPPGPLRLACVGILESRKNLGVAIAAVAACDPDIVKLDIYGNGPGEQRLRDLVNELNITTGVRFRGWVDNEEIWANTDLLLFPSLHEGAPNAVLEALSHGIPVLASDIPEHRELLPPTALLPATDTGAWKECLRKLCASPGQFLAALLEPQAARIAEYRFDWNTAVRQAILGRESTHSISTTHSG